MKAFMALGALAGFIIASSAGILRDLSWTAIFWRACLAAYATSLVFRWWHRCWRRSLAAAMSRSAPRENPQPNSSKP